MQKNNMQRKYLRHSVSGKLPNSSKTKKPSNSLQLILHLVSQIVKPTDSYRSLQLLFQCTYRDRIDGLSMKSEIIVSYLMIWQTILQELTKLLSVFPRYSREKLVYTELIKSIQLTKNTRHLFLRNEVQRAVKYTFSYTLKQIEMALLVTDKSVYYWTIYLVLLENGIR